MALVREWPLETQTTTAFSEFSVFLRFPSFPSFFFFSLSSFPPSLSSHHDRDAIFNAGGAGPNGEGVVYVVYGSYGASSGVFYTQSLLTAPNASVGYAVIGPNPDSQLGVNLYAGDLNGDGYDDLVLGCSNATLDGVTYPGATYIIWNGPNMPTVINLANPNSAYVTTFVGESDGDQFGTSVAVPGDMNGDGIIDFGATSPNNNKGAGAVYVIYGSKTKYSRGRISVRSLGTSMVSLALVLILILSASSSYFFAFLK